MKRFLFLLTVFCSLTGTAQQRDSFWKDLNNFLDRRADIAYAKFDSTYIGRYPFRWDARLFYKTAGMYYLTEGMGDNDVRLSTGTNHRVGVGIRYRGIGLSYSHAIGKKFNLDLCIDSYTKHFCVEYALRMTTGLSGSGQKVGNPAQDVDNVLLGESRLNLFYSFNPRFSYAAAMRQSQIQRRSAGSFIAALTWSVWDILELAELGDSIDISNGFNINELIQGLLATNSFYYRISLGGGYGYNWVLGHQHWLLHGSLVPMWTVYDAVYNWSLNEKYYKSYPNGWLSFSAAIRAGIYYRWGEHWSVGVSGLLNQMVSRNSLSRKAEGFTRFGAQDWQTYFSLTFRF